MKAMKVPMIVFLIVMVSILLCAPPPERYTPNTVGMSLIGGFFMGSTALFSRQTWKYRVLGIVPTSLLMSVFIWIAYGRMGLDDSTTYPNSSDPNYLQYCWNIGTGNVGLSLVLGFIYGLVCPILSINQEDIDRFKQAWTRTWTRK